MKKFQYGICVSIAVLALAGCSKPNAPGADDGDGGGTPPATAASAASPAAATADAGGGYSPMTEKPGLWEITQNMASMGNMKIATKMCVDASMTGKMASYGMNNQVKDTDCTKKSINRTADGADISMTCTSSGRTTDMHMTVKKISDTEFTETMDAKMTPAVAGHESVSMTMDGKWLGACPAGMKGGDIQVNTAGTGVSFNVKNAMAEMKARQQH